MRLLALLLSLAIQPARGEEVLHAVRDDSGCVASVAGLPEWEGLYSSEDPRLKGQSLVVVLKAQRAVLVFSEGERQGCWDAALAWDYPSGTKKHQGDRRTPEGWYRISDAPESSYYGAMLIHYPATRDADRGLALGLIDQAKRDEIAAAHTAGTRPDQYTKLGGRILIHGGGSDYDWTLGCVGMDNEDVDALRALLSEGKRADILILP